MSLSTERKRATVTPVTDEKLPRGKPFCCVIGCDADAEYQVRTERRDGGIAGPDIYADDTEACAAHVGEMLGHQPGMHAPEEAYWTVVPIEWVAVPC